MLRLAKATTDLLELVTTQNGAVVVVSYSDPSASGYPGDSQITSITSATTTTICDTPVQVAQRDIDSVWIANTYAGDHSMTPRFKRGLTSYASFGAWTVPANGVLQLAHAKGWFIDSSARWVDLETPSGTPDGILTTFGLASTPNPPASCIGYVRQGGAGAFLPMIYGIDFTLSGATITTTTAPDSGSNLRFSYRA